MSSGSKPWGGHGCPLDPWEWGPVLDYQDKKLIILSLESKI